MSLVLHPVACQWLCGRVSQKGQLHFESIYGAGDLASNARLFNESGQLDEVGLSALLEAALAACHEMRRHPKAVVVTLSSQQAYFCELGVSSAEQDDDIRFQIEDLLSDVAGESKSQMAYDWQSKGADILMGGDERQLAVAALLKDQLDCILEVCSVAKLDCLGVTLDAVSRANGYQRASGPGGSFEFPTLLIGTLNPWEVRLSVFMEGALFSETTTTNDDGDFTLVKGLSALERLVTAWTRSGPMVQDSGIGLILSGHLMCQGTAFTTAGRSDCLRPYLTATAVRPELAKGWHQQVVAFGAVEGLPCA
ncbi:MAG: hypothetical protein HC848_01210 [Limnobacter sp.]|nr:hypothetical protein [Limnobacter sp.]